MAISNLGNGYQSIPMNNNNYGNNYNYSSTTTPINTTSLNPPPAIIGFVRGRMGAGAYPIMSSNTTAYLFDVEDQTKFYIKQTDAFGMTMPLRQCTYHEDFIQFQPNQVAIPNVTQETAETKEPTDDAVVTKQEFDELKAQLVALTDTIQKQNYQQNKSRKERVNNV